MSGLTLFRGWSTVFQPPRHMGQVGQTFTRGRHRCPRLQPLPSDCSQGQARRRSRGEGPPVFSSVLNAPSSTKKGSGRGVCPLNLLGDLNSFSLPGNYKQNKFPPAGTFAQFPFLGASTFQEKKSLDCFNCVPGPSKCMSCERL